tara:strand:- start:3162 stop:3941 length:780 start_codon:yes stop_codon:yes gene_type:complete
MFTQKEDGYYYVDELKITGVGWLIRSGESRSGFCIENRVALTKKEQHNIGDTQPFMLNEETYNHKGNIIEDTVLAEAYKNKMISKGKHIKLKGNGSEGILNQIINTAKNRNKIFEERHFPMALLREAVKQYEHPTRSLMRGLSEECKKKFKNDVEPPQHKFVYERHNNTCVIVYFVNDETLIDDEDAINKMGSCNYFCAKSLYCINNDYLETRSHEILTNDEIEKRLTDFENKFGENGIGCDLKYWGGLAMWMECKKHF